MAMEVVNDSGKAVLTLYSPIYSENDRESIFGNVGDSLPVSPAFENRAIRPARNFYGQGRI